GRCTVRCPSRAFVVARRQHSFRKIEIQDRFSMTRPPACGDLSEGCVAARDVRALGSARVSRRAMLAAAAMGCCATALGGAPANAAGYTLPPGGELVLQLGP